MLLSNVGCCLIVGTSRGHFVQQLRSDRAQHQQPASLQLLCYLKLAAANVYAFAHCLSQVL